MKQNDGIFFYIPDKIGTSSHSTKLSDEKKQNLISAWTEVRKGTMSIYKAAKTYGIPNSTLYNWCERSNVDELPSVGRPCYLGSHLENKLKQWILEAARTGEYK